MFCPYIGMAKGYENEMKKLKKKRLIYISDLNKKMRIPKG